MRRRFRLQRTFDFVKTGVVFFNSLKDDVDDSFVECFWFWACLSLLSDVRKKEAEPPKPVEPREIAVTVEKMSYAPDAVQAKANEKLKFVFTRVSESRCGEEIVFP